MKRFVASGAALLLALTAAPAFAYVGPGAGLSLLGALWGLLVAILLALGFIILWPLRRWRRRRRAGGLPPGEGPRSGTDEGRGPTP